MADAEKSADSVFLQRSLNVQVSGDLVLLDAVAVAGKGGRDARLFFKTGMSLQNIRASDGTEILETRLINGAPMLRCFIDGMENDAGFVVRGMPVSFKTFPSETDLFSGLNVGFAQRNGESAGTVLDWLEFHVRYHGMDAALLLNRAEPGKDRKFLQNLQKRASSIQGLKRLVVLDSRVPLGREDLPAESHPFNAPGAPGKDRMQVPEPDPWRAPLADILLFELVKARFLSGARAVMNIDVFDLLARQKGPNVFDRAVSSDSGCIGLEGWQCYPWRIRKKKTVGFGDHIYVPFDARRPRKRWCVAPQIAGARTVWRLIRVVGATPAPHEVAPFNRFMALRHRADSVSKLVPKTSLVEDPDLLKQAKQVFDHKPVRMPKADLQKPQQETTHTTIVTTMKNEGPFILEWIAYHRAIGVSDFLIYTNDCTDGTDTLLDVLQQKGIVQHRENPFRRFPGLKPQHAALQAADKEELVRNADWLICMDVDEFINIRTGQGHLHDLFAAVGSANMIALTWRLFGNSDIHAYRDGLICEDFTRCAPELIRKPHQAWGFKTLFRNQGIFKKLGVHRPKGLKPQLLDSIRWVNGSGKPMPEKMFRNGWRSTLETFGYDLVSLNHYAVRSAESFLVKRDRGRVNHVERDQGLAYWFRMNNNAEEDRSIHKMLPALRAELARLKSDPEIAQAHETAVRKHQEKIAELKARKDYADFYRQLTSPRMEKLSRLHAHFGANVFLSGPDIIPEEIVAKNPDEPFVFTVEKGQTRH